MDSRKRFNRAMRIVLVSIRSKNLLRRQREIEWMEGSMTKIVLGVDSEAELLQISEAAKAAGLPIGLVKDEGRTVFNKPTFTCLGIGPAESEKFKAVTGHLKLF
jgi:PTH2 family peptidyl-tRNA hydrolase